MKKITCILIAMLLTACSYNNELQNNTTDSDASTGTDTEVGATEITTTGQNEETTPVLPEGMAYRFEDGTFISIDNLMTPMNKLNMICQGISGNLSFSGIYPDDVVKKLAEFNNTNSIVEYAEFMFQSYKQMYGNGFSIKNEYKSCSRVSDEDISDMIDFYREYFFTEINPDYAFIVESTFVVSYKDEEGNANEDSSSDFYIAYYMNNTFYIDYFFVDTLDL